MYEYKVIECENSNQLESTLNEMSNEGWEFVQTVFWRNWKVGVWAIFRMKKAK